MTKNMMIMPRQPMPLFTLGAGGFGVSGVDAGGTGVSLIVISFKVRVVRRLTVLP